MKRRYGYRNNAGLALALLMYFYGPSNSCRRPCTCGCVWLLFSGWCEQPQRYEENYRWWLPEQANSTTAGCTSSPESRQTCCLWQHTSLTAGRGRKVAGPGSMYWLVVIIGAQLFLAPTLTQRVGLQTETSGWVFGWEQSSKANQRLRLTLARQVIIT